MYPMKCFWIFIVTVVTFAITPHAMLAKTYAELDAWGVPTIAPLLEDVTNSVVRIAVTSEQALQLNPLFNDPFSRRYSDDPEDAQPQPKPSAGYGVIIDAAKGYVLTNNHVIENAIEITVTLKDHRTFTANVIAADSATDIVFVQTDADTFSPLPMGDYSTLLVGASVVAVGNPFGLGQTVTSGIISALDRSGINPEGYEAFIQTDASINPGTFDEALVTFDGKLVGIGFAVPINMAIAVMDQLIEFGEVRRSLLGVSIQNSTPDLAQALDLNASRGVVVSIVEPDSAADKASLQACDIISGIDGVRVESPSDLRNRIGLTKPGRTIRITLLQDGSELTVETTFEASGKKANDNLQSLAGAASATLEPGMAEYDHVAVSSAASQAGLVQVDVITGGQQQTGARSGSV